MVRIYHAQVPVYSNSAEGQALFTATVPNIEFTWTFLEVSCLLTMLYIWKW